MKKNCMFYLFIMSSGLSSWEGDVFVCSWEGIVFVCYQQTPPKKI